MFGDVVLAIVAVGAFFWLLRQNEKSPLIAFKVMRISNDRVAVWSMDSVYIIHNALKEDELPYEELATPTTRLAAPDVFSGKN